MERLHFTHPIHYIIGLTLWGGWFGTVYGGHALACEVMLPDPEQGVFTLINAMLLAVSLLATGLLAALTWGCWHTARRHQGRLRFNAWLSSGLYLFSTLGVIFTGMPIVGIPPCL